MKNIGPALVNCHLEIRCPSRQLSQRVQQKHAHHRKKVLTRELGNCITTAQATRLDTLGIVLQDLNNLRDSTTRKAFSQL